MSKNLKYDGRLKAVSSALEQVEAPGDFCTVGAHASFPLPGLVVDGVGDVLLPLTDTTAKNLISASHLAPFGHGEQTIVDTQVRNTWELSTNQFKITNPAFVAFVKDQITEACRGPLGIHTSVVFEAKLYKLLLYETGGKFERHQDSEKENGMFGTLVVVLPGRFEGGELVVHHPSAAGVSKSKTADCGREDVEDVRVFDAGAMDPFSLKYAAFYGDCPHEVRPVTKGYRLCLTYNLVKVASLSRSIGVPRFGSNHALYVTMKEALEIFFCADQVKRQCIDTVAAGFDVTNPETYRECKLVYVLTHKHTEANLSFDNLKNRDAVVAASLARFCDLSDGALGLYLCQMKYTISWYEEEGSMCRSDDDADADEYDGDDGGNDEEGREDNDVDDDGDDESIDRELFLQYPWVDFKTRNVYSVRASGRSGSKYFSNSDFTDEVAPCGFFDKKGFKYDGENRSDNTDDDGDSIERWYRSAALVIAPLQLTAKWNLGRLEDPIELLEYAHSKPAHTRAIARAIHAVGFNCWATSPQGVRLLETAARIDDVDLVCSVVAAFQPVKFQPKMREVISRFDAKVAVKKAIDKFRDKRSTINFVASILDGVTDPSIIATALDHIDAVPYVRSTDFKILTLADEDTTPEEFTRVLKLAILVSLDRAKAILDKCSSKGLLLVTAPANRLLFDATKGEPDKGAVVVAIANHATDLLKQKIPKFRSSAYEWYIGCSSHSTIHYGYAHANRCGCETLRAFMNSLDETAAFDKDTFDGHLKRKLEELNRLKLFSVEQPENGDAAKIVLKKTCESDAVKTARREIAKLDELVVEFVRVAVVSAGTKLL